MFRQKNVMLDTRHAIEVSGLGKYSIKDTLECGQCFRHRLVREEADYIEYMTVVGDRLVFVGQRTAGELLFFTEEEALDEKVALYFSLYTDYAEIKRDIEKRTSSEWLMMAAEYGEGIAILKQDEWETLFSFIVSQNNNIPRIQKIIGQICGEYGVNICLQNNIDKCPLSKIDTAPCHEKCKFCGACYTFPRASDITKRPEGLLPSKPGFRYKYLLDAAKRVESGETNLAMIAAARNYEHTVAELTKILGVGEKVASCTALFGFANLEAFPIDVWMKRAINEYFGGQLDHRALGRYAGVAQQYIFHYIRNHGEKE